MANAFAFWPFRGTGWPLWGMASSDRPKPPVKTKPQSVPPPAAPRDRELEAALMVVEHAIQHGRSSQTGAAQRQTAAAFDLLLTRLGRPRNPGVTR